MIELPYCLIIEATDEPDFFGFYSPDLEGFTGIGHSVEDCLFQAKWGMQEFVQVMAERDMAIPPRSEEPTVLIKNSGTSSTEQLLRQHPTVKRLLKTVAGGTQPKRPSPTTATAGHARSRVGKSRAHGPR